MAISISAATCGSLIPDRISSALASSSSTKFSSLQFPFHLRRLNLSHHRLCKTQPRFTKTHSLQVAAKKQTFSSLEDLLEKADKPVLVDFYATWCGPCQFMVPILEEVGASLKDKIQVVKVDTEKYPSIADKYRIAALPTFILFKDGKPCDRFEGALTAVQLIERIGATLEVKK